MFSVPRGYIDGFVSWSKQVVGLCLTAFYRPPHPCGRINGFNSNMLLGLGLMLAASEIPRIAGQFGLDTSTKGNLMSTMYGCAISHQYDQDGSQDGGQMREMWEKPAEVCGISIKF